MPITVVEGSKAWTVFARSNAGIAGSNPTQRMDICLCLFCIYIGSNFATGRSPVQGVLPNCLGIKKLKWNKAFQRCLMLQSGNNRQERDWSEIRLEHGSSKRWWEIYFRLRHSVHLCRKKCVVLSLDSSSANPSAYCHSVKFSIFVLTVAAFPGLNS
jgi:hypothetical protein